MNRRILSPQEIHQTKNQITQIIRSWNPQYMAYEKEKKRGEKKKRNKKACTQCAGNRCGCLQGGLRSHAGAKGLASFTFATVLLVRIARGRHFLLATFCLLSFLLAVGVCLNCSTKHLMSWTSVWARQFLGDSVL